MKQNTLKLTVSQFAKLHNVNKRTLHFYDSIGLFSPAYKGENGYRYYDYAQSLTFEYIRMLKELNMSIEEIMEYMASCDTDHFLKIADDKLGEIDDEIRKMKNTKKALLGKKEQLIFAQSVEDTKLSVIECKEAYFLTLPYSPKTDEYSDLYEYIKLAWDAEQYRMGVGSYLSVEKAQNADFDSYDGLFSPARNKTAAPGILTRPGGSYLCGCIRGDWERLPELYEKMFAYAGTNHLRPGGYAYETGLNEFAISGMDEYVTQILIKVDR